MLRYYELKKSYIQLGRKFNIPDNIITLLYNKRKESIKDNENDQRTFHKNILLFKLISSPFDTTFHIFANKKHIHKNVIQTWIKKYEDINMWNGFYDKILFEYRLPDGKNCEWAIKTSPLRQKQEYNDNITFLDIREKLMVEINILGENNYLKKYINSDNPICVPAERRLKIKYLNTSDFNEIYDDYNNFKNVKGTIHEGAWSMIIDTFGDATFL
jgi:hypothetical protein